jgi:deazaflavin-dependent oxidoreductase (nitroreductase family)
MTEGTKGRPERHTPLILKPAEWFISSRYGGRFYIKLATPIDRWLIPATNGRLSTLIGQPVVVLESVGAKSEKARRIPLLYMPDGDRVILTASNVGQKRHPAWYYNLKANPRAKLFMRGGTGWYTAHEAEGEERERLWGLVTKYYEGYRKYQTRAERRIPVMVLTPEVGETPAS